MIFPPPSGAGEILPSATGSVRMAPILRVQEIQGKAREREKGGEEKGRFARRKEAGGRKLEEERAIAARGGSGEQSKRTGRLFMATILQIYELVPVESSGRRVFPVQNV